MWLEGTKEEQSSAEGRCYHVIGDNLNVRPFLAFTDK
jgi:hypothetical protein